MKIVCGSCGAKYSIADEKVQGKVFKIRCKKCSNVIVVKGTSEESDFGSAPAAEWFVVINGDQVGPITAVDVDSYFMSGQIEASTYVWKDGMSDWLHLHDIPDFAHLTTSSSGASAALASAAGVADAAGPDDATNVVDALLYQRAANQSEDNPTVSQSVSNNFGEPAVASNPFDASAGSGPDPYGSDFAGGSDYGSSDYGAADYGSSDYGSSDYGSSNYASADSANGSSDYGAGYGSNGYSDSYASESSPDYGYPAAENASSGFGGYSEQPATDNGAGGGGLFSSFDAAEPESAGDFLSFGSEAQSSAPSLGSSSNSGYGSGATASVSSSDDMIGKRNENSVLFSLSSLDQVKAVPAASSAPSTNGMISGTNGSATGAVTEGSGLIDIQALASAHKDMSASNSAPQVDPFAHGTMAMPALAPMGSHRDNKPLIIAAVIGGVLLLGLIAAAVGVLIFKDEPPQEKIVERVIVEKAVPTPAPAQEEQKREQVAEVDKVAKAIAENTAPKEQAKPAEKDATPKKKTEQASAKEKKKVVKKTPEKKKSSGVDSLISKLDKTPPKEKKVEVKPEEKPASSGKGLSKSEVGKTIKRYSGRVSNCSKTSNKGNLSGRMLVKFSIKPSGRVTGAKVATSKFAGTDVGRCVQKVVAGMKFPSSDSSKNLPISYPFTLK